MEKGGGGVKCLCGSMMLAKVEYSLRTSNLRECGRGAHIEKEVHLKLYTPSAPPTLGGVVEVPT